MEVWVSVCREAWLSPNVLKLALKLRSFLWDKVSEVWQRSIYLLLSKSWV